MKRKITQKELQSQRTHAALRLAIKELLSEKNYDEFTIKDICDRANVAVGTFYKYYKSKDEILRDRYSQLDEFLINTVAPNLDATNMRKSLLYYADSYLHFHTSLPLARQMFKARLNGEDEGAKDRSRPLFTLLDELLENGQTLGQVRRDLDTRMMTEMLIILLRGYSYNICVFGSFVSEGQTLEEHINIWCDAILIDKKTDKVS